MNNSLYIIHVIVINIYKKIYLTEKNVEWNLNGSYRRQNYWIIKFSVLRLNKMYLNNSIYKIPETSDSLHMKYKSSWLPKVLAVADKCI